jgi:hypothetical protein
MSIYSQIARYIWHQNTMRAAYRRWQAQEGRLAAARERLHRDCQEFRQQAQQLQAADDQGILRAARRLLEQPLDPGLLMVKDRLARRLALKGRGLCSRVPPPLEVELSRYVAGMEKICRSHGELGARLRLARAMLTIFGRHPEFCRPRFFRLALIAPESAWLCFHLRRQRRQDPGARE